MPGLVGAAVGSIAYNGFTFPPAIHSELSFRYIQDSTKRSIKYIEVYLSVSGIICQDDFTNAALYNAIKFTLSQPGKSLTFDGQGLGSLLFNRDTDFSYGPMPQLLKWVPIGRARAAQVLWECKATINACYPLIYPYLAELGLDINFSIDTDGNTTRTVRGTAELLVYRNPGNGTTAVADSLRDLIDLPGVDGYTRNTEWTTSPDRRTLTFTIQDTQIPSDNPYSPHMTKMDVKERLSGGTTKGGVVTWDFSISGRITVSPLVVRSLAWRAFLLIVQDRVTTALNTVRTDTAANASVIFPDFEFENDIFARTVGFTISYKIVCDLRSILLASGIWRPINQGGWHAWGTSMRGVGLSPNGRPQSNRGWSNLSTIPADDVIVDICTQPPLVGATIPSPGDLAFEIENVTDPPLPNPDSSYYRYVNELAIVRSPATLQHLPTSNGDATSQFKLESTSPTGGASGTLATDTPPSPAVYPAIQNRGISESYLVMSGHAVRVGHKIELPKVLQIGGTAAILASEEVTTSTVIGWSGSWPIYAATWQRTYFLPQGLDTQVSIENNKIPFEYRV